MKLKPFFCALALLISLSALAIGNDRVVFDFDSPKDVAAWSSVNDGVMGGRSSGRFQINAKNNLEFVGTLSLENNGGFASIRARGNNLKMSSGDRIKLRVRGDGRKYNFNLYTRQNLGGYSYRQSFQTKKGKWMEVEMSVDEFAATWRGRRFPNQKLDPAKVAGLGILLGDKKAGPFKLEVDWIKIVSDSTK